MNLDTTQLQFIAEIKEKIRLAQYEALKAVNVQLINLYRELGKAISKKQAVGWGKAIVPALALELQKEFPKMSGFSVSNLWYMAQFYSDYQDNTNLEPLVREISRSSLQPMVGEISPHENPAIGIIICKSKDRTIVEYSLQTTVLPIGVATYQTTPVLPAEYQSLLPSANAISQKLLQFLNENKHE